MNLLLIIRVICIGKKYGGVSLYLADRENCS
jgi:hypothetical protein